jgi:hypothetical protein
MLQLCGPNGGCCAQESIIPNVFLCKSDFFANKLGLFHCKKIYSYVRSNIEKLENVEKRIDSWSQSYQTFFFLKRRFFLFFGVKLECL